MPNPHWTRAWMTRKKRLHIEVRDVGNTLSVKKVYNGKDHTLHIILWEEAKEKKRNGKVKEIL